MKKQLSIFGLLFIALAMGTGSAQTDSGQQPADTTQQPAAPAPALGADMTSQSIENPPLTSLDQPALEPGLAARSFIIPGVHIMDTADTNLSGDLVGKSAIRSVTRALGSVQLQRLWKNYSLNIDYAGGAAIYENFSRSAAQIHALDLNQRMRWRTGQISFRNTFSDLPEGTFGYSAFGGAGGYNLGGFGNVGGIQDAGGGAFFSAGQYGSLGQTPRVTNTSLIEVTQLISPRSSFTVTGSYGFTEFLDTTNTCAQTELFCCPPAGGTCQAPSSTFCAPGSNCCPPATTGDTQLTAGCLINSHQFAAQVGYNYQLNRRNQVALVYGFQDFSYPVTNLGSFTTNHFHVLFGHRISGRMDLQLGGGPQVTNIDRPGLPGIHQVTATGRLSFRYRFPRTTVSVAYDRLSTNGSGFFGGATSDVARFTVLRPLTRLWTATGDVGYTHNNRLLPTATAGAPDSYQSAYFGFGLKRQFSRYLGGYLTYQYTNLNFDIPVCSVDDPTLCGRTAQRHTVIIGLDWHPRPIRID